jgi:hypothetical protein
MDADSKPNDPIFIGKERKKERTPGHSYQNTDPFKQKEKGRNIDFNKATPHLPLHIPQTEMPKQTISN